MHVRIADKYLEDRDPCARYCHMNRKQTLEGVACRSGKLAVVNSAGPHHGEENCLRGWRGSGTIFFSWCKHPLPVLPEPRHQLEGPWRLLKIRFS